MEQWLSPPLLIAIFALVLSGINSYYARKRDNTKEIDEKFEDAETEVKKACDRISAIEGDLKVLSKQMNLFWSTVEQQMAKKFRNGE